MSRDQEMVQQLQQRLKGWNPRGRCKKESDEKCCEYDGQGRLIKLHFCKCMLSSVPPEVWQFSSLRELGLAECQLRTLPMEVGSLSDLEKLDLSQNQLRTLPVEVGNLSNLEVLLLSNNELSALPAEVGNLTALRTLWLGDNRLRTLPAEVGNLSNLRELFLWRNELSTLPTEIGNLTALQSLNLNNNVLRTLPMEIGNLTALQGLGLDDNRLHTLPAEVGNLSDLGGLSLRDNRLRALPAEMGNLSVLEKLNLDNNLLSTLPLEVGNLPRLWQLSLRGNPLQTPLPPLALGFLRGPEILEYFQLLQQAEKEQLEIKAVLERKESILLSGSVEAVFSGKNDKDQLSSAEELPTEKISREGTTPSIKEILPIKIFYCYAHEDRDLRDRIDKHLGVLKRTGQVMGWYDREIQVGTEWEREIEVHLSTASIILLLVSADFVNSDYCYGMEMQKALEMHEKRKAHVLPILLRPVDWQDAPFAKLQILPTGAIPVTEWQNQDKALEDVARQIRTVVNTLRSH